MKARLKEVKTLVFDVFGTLVDWRGSIIAEGRSLGRKKDIKVDCEARLPLGTIGQVRAGIRAS